MTRALKTGCVKKKRRDSGKCVCGCAWERTCMHAKLEMGWTEDGDGRMVRERECVWWIFG